MRIFGLNIGRTKAAHAVPESRGWRSIIHEPYTGAWQRNDEISSGELRQFFAIYSCVSLIAADISKLRARVMVADSDGVQVERLTPKPLSAPNRYQNHIQFKQWWLTSKLSSGNAYGLKQRSAGGQVEAIYILDPDRVRPLVATDGSVYYELSTDHLAGIDEATVTVPASEIIHDRYQPQYHPLIGVSPIAAAALSGKLGMRIQQESQTFFSNGAKPGGILTAPGAIGDDTANRLERHWQTEYTGDNAGKVAVVGDGLKFEPMRSTSVDSQLVEQLQLSAEIVCSCFHVPAFKIGFGQMPAGNKVEELNLIYYSDCLQVLIEEFEQCMTDGLALPERHSVELDIDALWRMDSESKFRMLGEAIKGVMAPNEARRRVNLKPVDGGDSVYMQQQNFSLEALARRDAQPNPFSPAQPAPQAPAPDPEPVEPEPAEPDDETKRALAELFTLKALQSAREAMRND